MERVDQDFIEKFKKDASFEDILKSLNDSLLPNETKFTNENAIEKYSTIHVTGAPRSGTTLINQYLASSLDIGYINNLIAAFWKAPIHGVHLSKKLLGTEFISNFKSDYGKTTSITEPHEFGYFWSDALGFTELKEPLPKKINCQDLTFLVNTLNNINNTFDKPVIYKSIFLSWYASRIVKLMPKTIFVYVKRDWLENAMSLLTIRKKYFNTDKIWASFKPVEYDKLKSLSPIEQVVGQVCFLNKSFEKQMSLIKDTNKILVNYEDFVEKPEELRSQIIKKSAELNGKVVKSNLVLPKNFKLTNKQIESDLRNEFMKAYAKFNDEQ